MIHRDGLFSQDFLQIQPRQCACIHTKSRNMQKMYINQVITHFCIGLPVCRLTAFPFSISMLDSKSEPILNVYGPLFVSGYGLVNYPMKQGRYSLRSIMEQFAIINQQLSKDYKPIHNLVKTTTGPLLIPLLVKILGFIILNPINYRINEQV